MPWNLLLFPLLGGYLGTQVFRLTRFRAQQLESYRLLIESAIFGVPLVIFAKLLWAASDCSAAIEALILDGGSAKPALRCLASCLFCPFNVETAFISFLLGALLSVIGNWIVRPEWAIRWNYRKYADSLYALLFDAFYEERRVSLTLDSRKVYVGVVIELPDLERYDDFVRILPLESGYRVSESLAPIIHTSYRELYQRIAKKEGGRVDGLAADDFEIVVPINSIKTARFFSEEIHNEDFAIQAILDRGTPKLDRGTPNDSGVQLPPEDRPSFLTVLLTALCDWLNQPKNTA